MDLLKLPFFDESHRDLNKKVEQLCLQRLAPFASTELEDPASSAVEYIALLGQEGLFDPALDGALESESVNVDLRSLALLRFWLASTSGLCDGAFGAHVQGFFSIALNGSEDLRAIYLPGMASGQTVTTLALLDGATPVCATPTDDGYVLSGEKSMVPLATVADQIILLARHVKETPSFSLFVVPADAISVENEDFVSPMPVGRLTLKEIEVDCDDALIGEEGQGLAIAQNTLDLLRLPTAAACLGLATQAIEEGTATLLQRGVSSRSLQQQQGVQWALADVYAKVHAARLSVMQAVWVRDQSKGRESWTTNLARQLAQDAAEAACQTIADLSGIRGLSKRERWTRLQAEVRALRVETEFLENPRTIIASKLVNHVMQKKKNSKA
ncbi:MAG: acyl-CoA/acyl-ACP dehydrogenase [Deltaproteobacteria bacterium]|nr:acyl-CoA/acyl-ACP dehydrogenase [Deltaproteobacteria bacterium]